MIAELREVSNPRDMESARFVRTRVFIEEQGVPQEIEMDEYDESAVHVICLLDGRPVGTGRLVRMPDGMKLGRVAVLREHRGEGLGTGIVRWLLARARSMGCERVHANVQVSAMAFYGRLGFGAVGEHFMEAGIEHVRMERALSLE